MTVKSDIMGRPISVGDWIVIAVSGTGSIEVGFARVVGITPKSKKLQIRQVLSRGRWLWTDQRDPSYPHEWRFSEPKTMKQSPRHVWRVEAEDIPAEILAFSDAIMCPDTFEVHLNGVPVAKP